MKLKLLFFCIFCFLVLKIQSQVGIGTISPDASSVLDVTATDKGVLVPRVNLTNVTNTTTPVAAPAVGLLVWNTNAGVTGGNGIGFYFFNGTQWTPIQQGVSNDHDWYEEGTTNAPDNINDDIFTMGNLAIGKNTADYKLDIEEAITSPSNLINTNVTSNISSGLSSSLNNQVDFTGSSGAYAAVNNDISGNGSPQSITGIRNAINVTTLNPMQIYGVYNSQSGSSDTDAYGHYNYITINGDGDQRGLYNRFWFPTGSGLRIGVENNINSHSTGDHYGTLNYIFNPVALNSSNLYGTRNLVTGSGSGAKYGSFNLIQSTSNGIHYAVYAEALKVSTIANPTYAGFFAGNVAIGTEAQNSASPNHYIFPPSRGIANQIMQTDGSGNVSWVDASTVGDDDHDFYEEGTTTAPDDINDDQYTMGHLAIGKNTADYPLDILDDNATIGAAVTLGGTDDSNRSGINSSISNSGNGLHFGTQNTLSGTGDGRQYGTHNLINNTGLEIHYGTYNTLTGTGVGRQYGVYNEIDNSGDSNHFGSYSALTGIGSGSHYGNWVRLEGAGTGNQIGAYNYINNTGNGDHYGSYNVLSGTGSGPHYGNWARLFGAGTGQQFGNYTLISNSGNATHYGDFIRLDGSGSGTHNGTEIQLSGSGSGAQLGTINVIDNSGDGLHYGSYNVLRGTGTGTHYGNWTLLEGAGAGFQVGYFSQINNSGNNTHYGMLSRLEGTGDGSQIGILNLINNTGIGNKYGVRNTLNGNADGEKHGVNNIITGTGSGNHYGVNNYLSGSGSDNKYGVYNEITASAGGTHYGVYSNVLKAGSYAGYFLGNVSIGTTTGNNYVLPASRGTNGQIMQTDGAGNVSWVNNPSLSYWSRTGTTLDVATAADDISFASDQTSIIFPNTNGTPSSMIYMFQGAGNVDRMVLSHSSVYPDWGLEYEDFTDSFIFKSATQERVEIDLAGGFPLRVYGTARAQNFQSDTTTYPDYVFESYYQGNSELKSDYSFKSLAEVESFIIENGHLPNVKSYQEIKNNNMTIDVGEMTVTNLEKIEEVFLYIIELKKENDLLKSKLKSQQQEINEIKEILKNMN